MKKIRLNGTFVSTVATLGGLGVLAVACASHPFKSTSRYPAGATEDVDHATAAPAQLSDEDMPAEKMAEKKAICGSDSLETDTLSDYPHSPKDPMTPYFPGMARVISNPHEAVLAKVALIQGAKKSIDVSTYIFTPDQSSNAYTDELNKALLRGVNVRLLIDAGGSVAFAVKDYYNQARSLLYTEENAKKAGKKVGHADVVVFHPLLKFDTLLSTLHDRMNGEDLSNSTISNFDRRSHDKILIIDREDPANTYAIVGGRNIDNSYYGITQIDENTYNDMDLIVKNDDSQPIGPNNLNTTLDRHFQDLFCSKGNRWLSTGGFFNNLADELTFHHAPLKDLSANLDGSLGLLVSQSSSDVRTIYNSIWNYAGGPVKYFRDGMVQASLHPASEQQNILRTFDQVFQSPDSPTSIDATYVAPGDNADSIYLNFLSLVKNAQKTIDILTPYIFLPPNERSCLKAWVMADPTRHIRLLSNSVSTSDSALAMSTFDGETAKSMAPQPPLDSDPYDCLMDGKHYTGNFVNGPLGSQRIEVYELGRMDNEMFKGNEGNGHYYGKLHAKFAVIDYAVPGHGSAWVGSDNLDERSRHLNSETAIFVKSNKIATDLKLQFDDFALRSVHFGDADWTKMQGMPEVKKRVDTMSVLDNINKIFPAAGFGD